MELIKSKVYIQTDGQGRITRCEGGYTSPAELTGWTEVDEGAGDRYNLCQSHYFEGGLYTMDGFCRWAYVGGAASLRTEEELEADRAAQPTLAPSAQEDADALLVDHEYRLTLLELCVTS